MKTRRTILCGLLAVILALTFTTCKDVDDNGGGGGDLQKWTAVKDSTIWDYEFTSGNNTYTSKASINDIAYGKNRFVAVGESGKIAYSTNGTTWTAVKDSTFPASYTRSSLTLPYQINVIAYGNGRFVAGGGNSFDENGKMAYSTNGTSWTAVADNTFGDSSISAITYGNNRFVAVGEQGKMAYSDDGENWTAVADSTVWDYEYTLGNNTYTSKASIRAIAYAKNRFVAVGDNGKMAYCNW